MKKKQKEWHPATNHLKKKSGSILPDPHNRDANHAMHPARSHLQTNFKAVAVFLNCRKGKRRVTSSGFLGHVSDAELRVGGLHLPPLLV